MLDITELMINDNIGYSLVSQLTHADTPTFDELFSFHTSIKNLVSSRLAYSDEADDVVQEVFLSAMNNLKGFRSQGPLAGWLKRIAVNKCCNHHRKRRTHQKLLAGAAWGLNRDAPPQPQKVMMKRETLRRVRQAVQALPSIYSDVITLRYFQQTPIADLAHKLAISPSLARLRLYRARVQLKKLLEAIS